MAPDRSRGYCERCAAEREVVATVPWQDDVCATCGSPDVRIE